MQRVDDSVHNLRLLLISQRRNLSISFQCFQGCGLSRNLGHQNCMKSFIRILKQEADCPGLLIVLADDMGILIDGLFQFSA